MNSDLALVTLSEESPTWLQLDEQPAGNQNSTVSLAMAAFFGEAENRSLWDMHCSSSSSDDKANATKNYTICGETEVISLSTSEGLSFIPHINQLPHVGRLCLLEVPCLSLYGPPA